MNDVLCQLTMQWSTLQLSSVDKQERVALMQSQQSSDDGDGELSLAAATYNLPQLSHC